MTRVARGVSLAIAGLIGIGTAVLLGRSREAYDSTPSGGHDPRGLPLATLDSAGGSDRGGTVRSEREPVANDPVVTEPAVTSLGPLDPAAIAEVRRRLDSIVPSVEEDYYSAMAAEMPDSEAEQLEWMERVLENRYQLNKVIAAAAAFDAGEYWVLAPEAAPILPDTVDPIILYGVAAHGFDQAQVMIPTHGERRADVITAIGTIAESFAGTLIRD